MIKRYICTFFSVFLIAVCSQSAFSKTFKFLQITDIHYSPDGNTASTRNLSDSVKNFRFAAQSINRQDASFVVFLGDSIDKSEPSALLNFLRDTQDISIPRYFVIGNHDSYKLTGIPKEDYLKLVRLYNPYQKSQKPYYFFRPNKEILAVVMDGASDFAPSAHGIYTDEMITWLDKLLEKNKDKIVLIFQHFPLIQPEENYSHSTLNSDEYMKLLLKYPNIALISSGHYHAEKVTIDSNGIYHISAPSLIVRPNSYQSIKIDYDKNKKGAPTNVQVSVDKIKI